MLIAPLLSAATLASVVAAGSHLAGRGKHIRRNEVALAGQKRGSGLPASVSNSKATWYSLTPEEGGTIVACDGHSPDMNTFFVAMNTQMFNMDQCYQWITITANGKTASAQILDSCPTCPTYGQLDMSPGLMEFFDPGKHSGVISISWTSGGGGGGQQPEPETTTKKPEPTPESTWSPPPPPPTSTWSPEPTTTTSTESSTTTTSSSTTTTSTVTSSSFSSSASANSTTISSTVSLNATSTLLNATTIANVTGTTFQLANATATLGHDAVVTDIPSAPANGNLAQVGNLVANIGRIIVLGASV
ncbi:hypothetical protein Q8F55_008434 [Vanrija albida]|uniref:RlpA-like protein double-psi beta-barrel domain-containing protein n=1 Tax=Vanrija albida TaxID=181172 RepID=A0ABR3PQZ3_9TREE